MADMARIEELEDRVVDMALEIGADVRVWRSWPEGRPDRVVRGLTLNIIPGLDTLSLLISPEGWLVPLMCIEDAENGTLSMPPYCFCKTQFGPPEGPALFQLKEKQIFSEAAYDKIRHQFDQIETATTEILKRFRGQ